MDKFISEDEDIKNMAAQNVTNGGISTMPSSDTAAHKYVEKDVSHLYVGKMLNKLKILKNQDFSNFEPDQLGKFQLSNGQQIVFRKTDDGTHHLNLEDANAHILRNFGYGKNDIDWQWTVGNEDEDETEYIIKYEQNLPIMVTGSTVANSSAGIWQAILGISVFDLDLRQLYEVLNQKKADKIELVGYLRLRLARLKELTENDGQFTLVPSSPRAPASQYHIVHIPYEVWESLSGNALKIETPMFALVWDKLNKDLKIIRRGVDEIKLIKNGELKISSFNVTSIIILTRQCFIGLQEDFEKVSPYFCVNRYAATLQLNDVWRILAQNTAQSQARLLNQIDELRERIIALENKI